VSPSHVVGHLEGVLIVKNVSPHGAVVWSKDSAFSPPSRVGQNPAQPAWFGDSNPLGDVLSVRGQFKGQRS